MWRLSIHPSKDSDLGPVDVIVAAESEGSVADLAAGLGRHLTGGTSQLLLAPTTDGRPWPADHRLADTPLRDGDVLHVSSVGSDWLARPSQATNARPRAVAVVISGPDAGMRVPIMGDEATIGRGRGTTVRLTDRLISRRHARVVLGASPLVSDSGSAHGTRVAGRPVATATAVEWGEPIQVGDTTLVLHEGDAAAGSVARGVLRSPRFGPALEAAELELPAAPGSIRHIPFPWPMMLMPALMGGVMFMWSRSPVSLVFMLGFPLMLLTNHIVQKRQARKEHAAEVRVWRADAAAVLQAVDDAAAIQREQAEDDEPDLDVVVSRATSRHPRLWVRQPADTDFLSVRAGRGPRPALVTAKPSTTGDRLLRAEASQAAKERAVLTDVPVPVPLGEHSLVAVVGEDAEVDAWVRAVLLRLAVSHSPNDVALTAALGQQHGHIETWLRWLPHAAPRPGTRPSVAVGPGESQELLQELATTERPDGHTVCLIDSRAGVPRRLVEQVAALAADDERRLRLLWLGRELTEVPAATGMAIDLRTRTINTRDRGGVAELTRADQLDLATTWRAARSLSGYHDEAATVAAAALVPQQVRLPGLNPDLADADDVEAVLARWSAARGLRAQIGEGAEGVVTIDLREDGPHGLVAGTTGAGKSELLQSLICSLALNNPPSRMNFLLVDYKGGAAFRECAQLPHTVGYITDLSPALVQRALISMHAELSWRERLLDRYGAKDLLALEASHPEVAPPSMLICVDEFAALLAEVPEFIDGMVSIAQRGRSLGMHMLLATQRPAGVVTPQIKANTDLRIALRVASTEDSIDVIDAPDAATISRRTPGRAYLRRTGHGTRELVQVAWVGAREERREESARVRVSPFTARSLPAPGSGGSHEAVEVHELTDLERIVTTTTTAFLRSGMPAPKKPWIPSMAPEIPLARTAPGAFALGTDAADEALVAGGASDVLRAEQGPGQALLGVVDRPARQEQVPWLVDYARAGHLLVFGATGAGKTELLRTAAAAITGAAEPAPPCVYGIDAAGGGLSVIQQLPSVGAVVTVQDVARMLRLIRMLHRTVEHRNAALAAAGAADIASMAGGGEPMRRIHLLIDNLPAVMECLDGGGSHRRQHVDQLVTILQEGRRCGVHVTATSPQRTGLPSQLQASFGQRLVLRMSVADDYAMLGVPGDVLDADSPAGRGLVGSDEVQIATVGGAGTPAQSERLAALATAVADVYAEQPRVPVPAFHTHLPQHLLPAPQRDEMVIGVEEDLVAPVSLALTEAPLLVTGRSRSGRTSALLGLAQLARRSTTPPRQITLIGPKADEVAQVAPGAVDAVVTAPAAATELAGTISEGGVAEGAAHWHLLLIDDVHEWERAWEANGEERQALEALSELVSHSSAGLAVVAATDPDEARSRQHIPGLISVVRRARRAILLGPEMADGTIVGAQVPMASHEPLTGQGRGLLVSGGIGRVVQVVSPSTGEEKK
ncbi:MAG TPA: FtsK/SpoIIIE domain-containing protein [Actinomycetaceae bacterium]|nr:FtsK/SpoIIIE domain-containing protein [Actinomycetaceae bacterium]